MFGPRHQRFGIVRQRVFGGGEAVQRRQDAAAGAVNGCAGHVACLNRGDQLLAPDQRFGIFNVQTRLDARHVINALYPIRMDKAVKAPFITQYFRQKLRILPAIGAVHLVIGAHHAGTAGIDGAFEMRQIDFVQRSLVDLHIDIEASIFHAVEGEMLDRGDYIMGLDAHCQRGAHFAQMVRILAIGFLRPAPGWMAQQVETDRT